MNRAEAARNAIWCEPDDPRARWAIRFGAEWRYTAFDALGTLAGGLYIEAAVAGPRNLVLAEWSAGQWDERVYVYQGAE